MNDRDEFVSHIVDIPSSSSETTYDDDYDEEKLKNIKNDDYSELQKESLLDQGHLSKKLKKTQENSKLIQECRSVDVFEILEKIEEGSYGIVYKAREKETNKIYALKHLKMGKQTEGFPITSIREIITLLMSKHKNILTVKELVLGHDVTKIYIVMEFVEQDLKALMLSMRNKRKSFSIGEIKCILLQLLSGVLCLHDNWIIHRDLKPSNILIGNDGILKIADFGLCRLYASPLKQYTPIVVTLYYRSLELLLGIRKYSTFVDMWSIGCIMAELYQMEPFWQGKSEKEMLNLIFKDLGVINENSYPNIRQECRHYDLIEKIVSKDFVSKNNNFDRNDNLFASKSLSQRFDSKLSNNALLLLLQFFKFDPHQRIAANHALSAKYFQETPQAIDPSLFPVFPQKNAMTTNSKEKQNAILTKNEKFNTPGPPEGHRMIGEFDPLFFGRK